jgi:hypothetical protein
MKLVKLLVLSFAFAALAFGAIAGAEEPSPEAPPSEPEAALMSDPCFANAICRYVGLTFNVRDKVIQCSEWGTYAGFGASAKNRCGNKSVWLRRDGVVRACMNPGGERPHIDAYNEIFVPFNYGAAC